jgi:GT2 family glycosyltransferase
MAVPQLIPSPVRRQEWRSNPPPTLGTWTPHLSLTVVLPARDCQGELNLTLAALAEQSYPADLFDVIVVDDNSEVPLVLPDARPPRTAILRLKPGEGHGSGRARHAGALASNGELLLFLDADMVATRQHVEAHARWHHVIADAVVVGRKYFVDFDGINPDEISSAVRHDRLDALLHGRPREPHYWLERFIERSKYLTDWAADTFIAVVGASVSTPRALYQESGGFSSAGIRGIVDTEFGYRIFTAGGVVVAEMESITFHQGARNFAVRGDEIKRERLGLAANYLPVPLFRPANTGRTWAVPSVTVIVEARHGQDEHVLLTVDSVLASSFTDLAVVVASNAGAQPQSWLTDYFAHDPRVSFTDNPVKSGFPSPFTAVIPAGAVLSHSTLTQLIQVSSDREVGLVRATLPGVSGSSVELWATRALHRSRRHQRHETLEQVAQRLFGEFWLSGEDVGLRPLVLTVTRQGMIVNSDDPQVVADA